MRSEQRTVLTRKMIRDLLLHFGARNLSSFQDYTFERHPTDFNGANADLNVFDASGSLVFLGREYRSGVTSYWRPSRVSSTPLWAITR